MVALLYFCSSVRNAFSPSEPSTGRVLTKRDRKPIFDKMAKKKRVKRKSRKKRK